MLAENVPQRIAALLLAFLCVLPGMAQAEEKPSYVHPVEVRILKSPYSDFLFYLFYRSTGNYPQLEKEVPLDSTPTLDHSVSLPEQAASLQPKKYRDLYPLLTQYENPKSRVIQIRRGNEKHYRILAYSDKFPPYQQLVTVVHDGAAFFPKFEAFWAQNIAPAEDRQMEGWKQQMKECDPLTKLQEMERLSFPFSYLDIAAIALHLSGSGNTYPAGVYSGLFDKPNLAWVLGHEGTHLMVDRYAGHNWQAQPQAAQAIALIQQRGGKDTDIEESLSLFMQLKLSQACGYSKPDKRMSDSFPADMPKGAILRALEDGWGKYQADASENIMRFLVRQSISALQTMSVAKPK